METVRHATQMMIIETLERTKAAVERLPPGADAYWSGDFSGIYIDRDSFVTMFRGQAVTRDEATGTLSITVDGVRWCSLSPDYKPRQQTTEVVI